MNPKILLSVNTKRENYINAVNNCGGIAVAQYCPEFSTEYDGLILCGGSDIEPKYYNEPINGSVNIDANRDMAEFALVKAFVEKKKPIMGICRGFQILNVAFGGSLYQDISNSNEHRSSSCDLVHSVTATKNSILYNMYGAEFFVNSKHHQALKEVGTGFDVMATTSDKKIVEGIIHRELPVFGVQWHPERMCFENKREDTVDGSEIFRCFIGLCCGFGK
ncbi:MAG: gamma-glutamyl-gamma-aminobutyrate hydrolase family protein [Clostridia bacterium]|nr:gamma-glutamyl-gamma-aminobutyrate hydrolase family protein [Clostridia bacterium]